MYNPEFRYLLIQEENAGEMLPIINPYIFAGLFVFITNIISFTAVVWLAYKMFIYSGNISKYIWISIWNMLTPGNEWLDILLIGTTIISAVMMFKALIGITDILDAGFTKLKNELRNKDERIKLLEEKLSSIEGRSNIDVNIKSEKDINTDEGSKKLDN